MRQPRDRTLTLFCWRLQVRFFAGAVGKASPYALSPAAGPVPVALENRIDAYNGPFR